MSTALLALEHGTGFEGGSFDALTVGQDEVVFKTSITGYQEISPPSYSAQIASVAYPEIGNYGSKDYDWNPAGNFSKLSRLSVRGSNRRNAE
jgi:carbamoyl-phosphate synthase small subunit